MIGSGCASLDLLHRGAGGCGPMRTQRGKNASEGLVASRAFCKHQCRKMIDTIQIRSQDSLHAPQPPQEFQVSAPTQR